MDNSIQYKNLIIKSAEVDEDKRIFKAVISSSDMDLANEVLLPTGAVLKGFIGTILFNHNQDKAIGKSLQINRRGNELIATGQLAEPGTDGEIDKIWSLMKQGIIRGISVGFKVLKDGIRPASKKDLKEFGKDVISVITRWKLIEFSVVTIPCNQSATVIAMKSIGLNPNDYGVEIEEAEVIETVVEDQDDKVKEMEDKIEKQIEELDIEIKQDTKDKILESVKEKDIDMDNVMKYFKDNVLKQIRKSKGNLY